MFRRLASGVYWLMAIGLAASVALSATWGAYHRPSPPAAHLVPAEVTPASPAGQLCARDLKTLHGELVERAGRTFVGDGGPSPDMLGDWAAWSVGWRERLESTQDRCRLSEVPAMKPIERLASHLERLHLAYTTAINSFSDVGRRQLVETRMAFEELGLDLGAPVTRP